MPTTGCSNYRDQRTTAVWRLSVPGCIRNGRLVIASTGDEIMSDDGLYAILFNEGLDEYHREVRKYYEERLRDVHATKDYEIAMLKRDIAAFKEQTEEVEQLLRDADV